MVLTQAKRIQYGLLGCLALGACRFQDSSSDVAAVPKATVVKDEESGGGDVKFGPIRLTFNAIGVITIKKRFLSGIPKQNVVTQQVTTTYEGDSLNVVVSGVHTDNKRVNKELQSKNGSRVFTLASKKEIDDLKKENADYKKAASVIMFAKSVTSEGVTWEIKPPLPVYVLPTNDPDRYKKITDEGITFNGTISKGAREFQAAVSVRKIIAEGDNVQLEINWQLPEDQKGQLYEQLPMARFTSYEVDTKLSVVKRIWTGSIFNDGGEPQTSDFLYRICSYEDDQDNKNNKDFVDSCSGKPAPGEVFGRPQ